MRSRPATACGRVVAHKVDPLGVGKAHLERQAHGGALQRGSRTKHEFPDSSNLKSIEHDPDSLQMTVEFKNGGKYRYHGVPASHVAAIKAAPSAGAAFHQLIKLGGHRFEKR